MNDVHIQLKEYFDTLNKRYQSALYCFYLYTHLHRTIDKETYPNGEAEKNCDIRNELPWILGENTEVILLNCACVYMYGIFENDRDTVSIYKVLDLIRKNLPEVNDIGRKFFTENNYEGFIEINTEFLNGMDEKFGRFRYLVENDLRNYRHTIGHNFSKKKKRKTQISLNTEDIESLLHLVAEVLNEISVRLYSSSVHYDEYSEEIFNDYRKLFSFLNHHEEVACIMGPENKNSDEDIIRKLNAIYRPISWNNHGSK